MWLVRRILAAFVAFSPMLSKKGVYYFIFICSGVVVLFSAQASQMDILIGTFGAVSILR